MNKLGSTINQPTFGPFFVSKDSLQLNNNCQSISMAFFDVVMYKEILIVLNGRFYSKFMVNL